MPPSKEMLSLMWLAAEMRAGGASWARVGERVGRDPETCRQWPRRYRAAWRRFYLEAEAQVGTDTAALAQVRLRQQVLSEDKGVSERATRFSIQCRHRQLDREAAARAAAHAARAAQPAPDEPVVAFVRHVKALSDEELAAQLQAMLERRAAGAEEVPKLLPPT